MSFDTYTTLQTAMGSWLTRDDLPAATFPDCITLFEAAANRRLRVRQMELVTSLTPASGDVSLPADYLAWRRLTWTGSPRRELDYVEPSWLQMTYSTTPAGIPQVFTIEASTLKIRPTDATSLDFLYYQKIPALSSTNATNWLLTAHPDVYLFGALCEVELFTENDARAPMWKGRRDEIFDEIEKLSNKTRGAGQVRVVGNTP